MNQNTKNISNSKIRSVKDLLIENEELHARNEFLQEQNALLRRDIYRLTEERNKLINRIQDTTFIQAELAAEKLEREQVSALASLLGDD